MTFKVHAIEDAPEKSKDILRGAREKFGFVPNQMGILSESPSVLEAYMTLDRLAEELSFSDVERHVVIMAVSRENGCEYCMSAHSKGAEKSEISANIVSSLRTGGLLEDKKLEALRSYTLELMRNRGHISSDIKKMFLDAGYKPHQALEILLIISMKTLSNYANNLAHTPLDEQFQDTAWQEIRAA